jgi:hypothetical protein
VVVCDPETTTQPEETVTKSEETTMQPEETANLEEDPDATTQKTSPFQVIMGVCRKGYRFDKKGHCRKVLN